MKQNEQLLTVPIDRMIYRQARAAAALRGLSLSEFVRLTLKTEIQRETTADGRLKGQMEVLKNG